MLPKLPQMTSILLWQYATPRFYQLLSRKRIYLPLIMLAMGMLPAMAQKQPLSLHYTISIPDPASHTYQVQLQCSNWQQDSISFKMPRWMPGYYQTIDYAKSVEHILASDAKGNTINIHQLNDHTWALAHIKNKPFTISYTIKTSKQFVANSYADSAHAYIIPENTFLYIDEHLNTPVTVSIENYKQWTGIATGLEAVKNKPNTFKAPNFDILYDCPMLLGNLQALPSFTVNGINHRFIGYKMASFNQQVFVDNLQKIVQAASGIIGDIPYNQYTFIGIGPGNGGIEHLNNTTISFDGAGLDKPEVMNRTLNFIAHEYFHHYNVKRIRPFELGPFDYEKGSRTNLLWVSEGLSVYYEYLIVKRAGLADAKALLANFERNLNTVENNPGRLHQSLQQASYNTWSDGPFGTQGNEPGKSISYYDKGPLVGLLLDFAIRNATQNKQCLDDVMRQLYWKYYKGLNRGFTEAELQATAEQVAGIALTPLFEYVYTTKELDYNKYLAYGGLKIEQQTVEVKGKPIKKLQLVMQENATPLQTAILQSWMGAAAGK